MRDIGEQPVCYPERGMEACAISVEWEGIFGDSPQFCSHYHISASEEHSTAAKCSQCQRYVTRKTIFQLHL